MKELHVLQELVVVMGAALLAAYLFHRIRLPAIVGFFAAGILIGPSGLGLVADKEAVHAMAEIGVVLLLFAIGLKFSLRDLIRMKVAVFGGGGAQVVVTAGLTALAWILWGAALGPAVFMGFLAALSSTAIVLRLLEEGGQVEAPHGRFATGILLFQDLAVIPMMLLLPLLAGQENGGGLSGAAWALGKSAGLLVFFVVAARYAFPWFIERAARTRNREIFTLCIVLVAIGTAYLAGLSGISLALGAFLAGMVISESEYSHQIVSEISPFRDVFTAVFFVSIGMLVNLSLWRADPLGTIAWAVSAMAFKAAVAAIVALAFGLGIRVALLAGVALSQIGEFSLILARAGLDLGLIGDLAHQKFLSAAVLTMSISPLAIRVAPLLARRLGKVPALWEARRSALSDHVLIVGYGVNGQSVAKILAKMGVSYLVLELNAFTVRALRGRGENVIFGDATRAQVLRQAGVDKARALVVSIPDPASCRQIVAQAKEANPTLSVLVRSRYWGEVGPLYRLGAEEVVTDEFEAALALAGRIMAVYGMPRADIDREIEGIRHESYSVLREERRAAGRTPPGEN